MIPTGAPNQARGTARLTRTFVTMSGLGARYLGAGGPAATAPSRSYGVRVISYEWRGNFDNDALNQLHAEGFEHPVLADDWLATVDQHSLGWVCAWDDGALVGFVNVVWDGTVHAFILDTLVTELVRRQASDRACQRCRPAGSGGRLRVAARRLR